MTFTLNQSTHKAIGSALLHKLIFICTDLVAIYRSTCNVERLSDVVFCPSHRPPSSTNVYNTFASNWDSDFERIHFRFNELV
jgi:hypothetical protein